LQSEKDVLILVLMEDTLRVGCTITYCSLKKMS